MLFYNECLSPFFVECSFLLYIHFLASKLKSKRAHISYNHQACFDFVVTNDTWNLSLCERKCLWKKYIISAWTGSQSIMFWTCLLSGQNLLFTKSFWQKETVAVSNWWVCAWDKLDIRCFDPHMYNATDAFSWNTIWYSQMWKVNAS